MVIRGSGKRERRKNARRFITRNDSWRHPEARGPDALRAGRGWRVGRRTRWRACCPSSSGSRTCSRGTCWSPSGFGTCGDGMERGRQGARRQRAPSGGAMANPRQCDDTMIAADAMCSGPVHAEYLSRVPGIEGLLSDGDRGNVRGHGVHVALRHGVGAQRHRRLVLGRFSLHRVGFPSRCGVREGGRVRARNFADDVGTSNVLLWVS